MSNTNTYSSYLKLHGAQFVNHVTHVVLDLGPCDLVGGDFHGVRGLVIEGYQVSQHADRLKEGTVAIVSRVTVLLQEVILDDSGHFQGDLVGFSEGGLTRE